MVLAIHILKEESTMLLDELRNIYCKYFLNLCYKCLQFVINLLN